MEREHNMQICLLACAAGMQGAAAGMSQSYTTGYADNPYYGYAPYYGYTTTYDYSKQMQVNYQNYQVMQQANMSFEERYKYMDKMLAKRTTLYPGDAAGGFVFVKYREADSYMVTIPIGNTVHTIKFVPEIRVKKRTESEAM